MNDGLTHFVGDKCEGGHRPTLVERLDHARIQLTLEFSYDSGIAGGCIGLLREAADRLERMEAVVEAARTYYEAECDDGLNIDDTWKVLGKALAALDGQVVSGDENKSTYHNLAAQVTDATRASNLRPCPNAVSWCGGPDHYGDTCAACLATWTEEAKEKV